MKKKQAEDLGIDFQLSNLNVDITQYEVIQLIKKLNNDTTIHGIIVQLPIPIHLNESDIIEQIDPNKDVDGLFILIKVYIQLILAICSKETIHQNLFRINPLIYFRCTPKAIMELLKYKGNFSLFYRSYNKWKTCSCIRKK